MTRIWIAIMLTAMIVWAFSLAQTWETAFNHGYINGQLSVETTLERLCNDSKTD